MKTCLRASENIQPQQPGSNRCCGWSSVGTVALDLPPASLPAHNDAHTQFRAIKADLRRRQRERYDSNARHLQVPDGKVVYMRKETTSSIAGQKTRFLHSFDGPFLVTGHPHNRQDLLNLRHIPSGQDWPHPVNVEKIVVVPYSTSSDISPLATVEGENDAVLPPDTPMVNSFLPESRFSRSSLPFRTVLKFHSVEVFCSIPSLQVLVRVLSTWQRNFSQTW